MGMGERGKHSIFVEVMVGCFSWYINEEVVRASELLLVVNGSMQVSYMQGVM